VHQLSCGGALWSIGCVLSLRVSEGDRQAGVERQINTIRAATESMQKGLREVRSELYAVQQLQRRRSNGARSQGQQAEQAPRQEGCALSTCRCCEDGRGLYARVSVT
jgi:hypothetical protein